GRGRGVGSREEFLHTFHGGPGPTFRKCDQRALNPLAVPAAHIVTPQAARGYPAGRAAAQGGSGPPFGTGTISVLEPAAGAVWSRLSAPSGRGRPFQVRPERGRGVPPPFSRARRVV